MKAMKAMRVPKPAIAALHMVPVHQVEHLHQVGAGAGQAAVAQRGGEPPVPHELPGRPADRVAAGERARQVGGLAVVVRVVQRVLRQQRQPVQLLLTERLLLLAVNLRRKCRVNQRGTCRSAPTRERMHQQLRALTVQLHPARLRMAAFRACHA